MKGIKGRNRPVVGTVLVVISQLKPKHVVHELYSNVVAEEDDVVTRGGIGTEIRLSGLRDARVAHKRRPHQAVHRLIPQNGTEGSVIQRGEQAHHGLVVVLPDLLGDEPSLVLVVNSKTRIQVDLIHEICNKHTASQPLAAKLT